MFGIIEITLTFAVPSKRENEKLATEIANKII